MKTHLFLYITAAVLMSGPAHAFLNVCELRDQPVDGSLNVSADRVQAYRSKLKQECDLYKSYNEVRAKAQEMGVNLDSISFYQAVRYIDPLNYTYGEQMNYPVQRIFQLSKADSTLPLAQRSDLVWRNWSAGIQQMPKTLADIQNGVNIDLKYFENIHRGFYTVGDESGDLGTVGRPGELKRSLYPNLDDNDYYQTKWPMNSAEEYATTARAVKSINEDFRSLGLLSTGPAGYILDLRENSLFPAHPRAVEQHLKNMMNFMNVMLEQGRNNQHMVWKGQLFTPSEVALFVQQYIVQIHGFSDGNGRTSRFWQDVILTIFDLPYAPTVELSTTDMITLRETYYQAAMSKSRQKMSDIKSCFTDVYPSVLPFRWKKKGFSLYSVPDSSIQYRCRLLKY